MIKYVPSDKGTHYFYTQLLCIAFYAVLLLVLPKYAVILALILTLLVTIGVERYQGYTATGVEDPWDAAWGFCGAVVSFFTLWLTQHL
jgi:glycopeptide antibiotics resistance protein